MRIRFFFVKTRIIWCFLVKIRSYYDEKNHSNWRKMQIRLREWVQRIFSSSKSLQFLGCKLKFLKKSWSNLSRLISSQLFGVKIRIICIKIEVRTVKQKLFQTSCWITFFQKNLVKIVILFFKILTGIKISIFFCYVFWPMILTAIFFNVMWLFLKIIV